MKITDNNPLEQKCSTGVIGSRNIYIGIVLVAAGIVWLLSNLNVLCHDFFEIVFSWQMLLVVIGGYLMSLRKWIVGAVTAAVGIVFGLTQHFGVEISFTKVVLPVILIAAGVGILLQRKRQ